MAAQELGGGVDYDIRTVLDGADQVRCAKGVVDDQRQAVLVSDGCDSIDIGNIGVGVAQGLQIDSLGVFLNGVFQLGQVVGIDEGGAHAILGQGVRQQVIAAAVDGLLGHDVVTSLCQGLNGVSNSCRAGGQRQSCHAAFQSRDALFQYILGGVGQSAVNIAGICKTKPGSGMGGIAEDIRSGLVDGDCAGIGSGIGLFLANVQLQSFKFIIRHNRYLFHLLFII